ncbi:MAG: hypothetical protein ACOZCL_17015 [Bacillota bacterium]
MNCMQGTYLPAVFLYSTCAIFGLHWDIRQVDGSESENKAVQQHCGKKLITMAVAMHC